LKTGPIATEVRSERVDLSHEIVPLWEAGAGAPVQMPYHQASAFSGRAQRLISTCRSAVVCIGSTSTSLQLLNAVLDAAKAGGRIYLYADEALARNKPAMARLATLCELVLPRFGPPPPADWVIANGVSGFLLFGPQGADRTWLTDVERETARSLVKAFTVLFWSQATLEGLPDGRGVFDPRPPLPSPFPPPRLRVELAAGRIWFGGDRPQTILDAEISVLPAQPMQENASLVFLPPTPDNFDQASQLAASGVRVVWSDLGLPKTAVSIERMMFELVEGRIGIQLEWPKGDAIRLLQSLKAAAAVPLFEFHPGRLLGALRNPVLLRGWAQAQPLTNSLHIDLGEIVAPLQDFDNIAPDLSKRAVAPALALEYSWRVVPEAPPLDAREATIVRQWRLLDEWAARAIETCRALMRMAGDGALAADAEHRLTIIAQAPLSRDADLAAERTADLQSLAEELRDAVVASFASRRESLLAAEEARQRADWTQDREAAARELSDHAARVAQDERELRQLQAELATANAEREAAMREFRDRQRAGVEAELSRLTSEIDQARAELAALDRDEPGGKAPKAVRKPINARIDTLNQQAAALRRSRDKPVSGAQAFDESDENSRRREQMQREIQALRDRLKEAAWTSERLGRAANEDFAFRPPAAAETPVVPRVGDPPPTPAEGLPELGELLEHDGRRYLTIKTWAQLRPATAVAQRLGATLVTANRRA
jgi:hypothetical protein